VVSISENRENIAAMLKILKDLEIPFQILPQFSNIEQIERAGRARATITLNSDEGGYFAKELEEVFGVPYIRTSVPAGLRGTRHWILKLAKELGMEESAKRYVEQQEEAVDKLVHLKPLDGKHVFLNIDLAAAVHFVYLIEKLGGSIHGISVPYVDLENRENLKKLHSLSKVTTWIVANGQPFEKANVLSKKAADFYISSDGQTAFALSQGAVPISLKQTGMLGYDGLKNFVKQMEKGNCLLENNWLRRKKEASFYKSSWLQKSSNWYVKQEVK
jgi:nitrogenase molybdenum-iron protein alpha chain